MFMTPAGDLLDATACAGDFVAAFVGVFVGAFACVFVEVFAEAFGGVFVEGFAGVELLRLCAEASET
jgi:hypothetical protein